MLECKGEMGREGYFLERRCGEYGEARGKAARQIRFRVRVRLGLGLGLGFKTRIVEFRQFIYVSIQLSDFFFDIVECGFTSDDAFEDLARLVEVLVEIDEDRSKSRRFNFEENSTNRVCRYFLPCGKYAFWGSWQICNSWHYQLAHVPTEKL